MSTYQTYNIEHMFDIFIDCKIILYNIHNNLIILYKTNVKKCRILLTVKLYQIIV